MVFLNELEDMRKGKMNESETPLCLACNDP